MSKRRVRKRRLRADFLNRYVFASAGLDTIYTARIHLKELLRVLLKIWKIRPMKLPRKELRKFYAGRKRAWKSCSSYLEKGYWTIIQNIFCPTLEICLLKNQLNFKKTEDNKKKSTNKKQDSRDKKLIYPALYFLNWFDVGLFLWKAGKRNSSLLVFARFCKNGRNSYGKRRTLLTRWC